MYYREAKSQFFFRTDIYIPSQKKLTFLNSKNRPTDKHIKDIFSEPT